MLFSLLKKNSQEGWYKFELNNQWADIENVTDILFDYFQYYFAFNSVNEAPVIAKYSITFMIIGWISCRV